MSYYEDTQVQPLRAKKTKLDMGKKDTAEVGRNPQNTSETMCFPHETKCCCTDLAMSAPHLHSQRPGYPYTKENAWTSLQSSTLTKHHDCSQEGAGARDTATSASWTSKNWQTRCFGRQARTCTTMEESRVAFRRVGATNLIGDCVRSGFKE